MKNRLVALYFGMLCLASFSSHSAVIFKDTFETGDMSATNADGFKWSLPNKTSVVTSGGQHVLRFSYPAGNHMSEQRFRMGAAYRDLWISYRLRVPTNFRHGTDSPTNAKLFAIWMDGYSSKGQGPNVVWAPWNNGSNGSTLSVTYKEGPGILGPHHQQRPWISYPSDQGRWMQIVLHVKASTGNNSDAVIETYRRWDGESNFTQIHKLTGIKMPPPAGGPNGWQGGYIQGWLNAPYVQDTEWLLDDFTLSTTSLLGGGATPAPEPQEEEPSPPVPPVIKN